MSSSTNPGDRSADEIERDVERSRARLVGTAEELKQRVSPGNVADQAMEWLRGSGGTQFMSNLGTTLRDNPMPVLLIAGGIAWLAMSGRSDSRGWSDGGSTRWRGAYGGEDMDDGPSLSARAGEVASSVRETAGSAWESAKETVRSATGSVTSAAQDAASAVTGAAQRAGEAIGATGRSTGYRAARLGDTADDYGRGLMDAFERQPLLFGALGLAVGATLGAIFPPTEAENRLMGETRDQVADRVSDLAEDAYGQARESLGEVAGGLKEAVARTAEQVTGAASSAGTAQGGSATGVPPAKSGPEGRGPV
ncbi:DUF3618 domain-containing protein [Falsiroseomonas sp. HW251]|uniref:DUF3618 domain-containing protein n=1 Tax=Falsiroseomonas sp. HW251 TaxID=3390998 RepID=UPI003D30F576